MNWDLITYILGMLSQAFLYAWYVRKAVRKTQSNYKKVAQDMMEIDTSFFETMPDSMLIQFMLEMGKKRTELLEKIDKMPVSEAAERGIRMQVEQSSLYCEMARRFATAYAEGRIADEH